MMKETLDKKKIQLEVHLKHMEIVGISGLTFGLVSATAGLGFIKVWPELGTGFFVVAIAISFFALYKIRKYSKLAIQDFDTIRSLKK